jgi:secondary thiamine-phosphate synthase enzyme
VLYRENISTRARSEILDITVRVAELVRASGITEGLCVVYVPHTTAAVSINENADPDVKRDVLKKLAALIPRDEAFYRHGEGNSDSHVKTILTGPSIALIIERGSLVLGTWQGIYFCEYDGPRTREFLVKIVKG